MKYTVYVDAACSLEKQLSGCAYIILTDENFIGSDSVKVKDIVNPTHAETVCVGLAAAYLMDNVKLKGTDTVIINTDSASSLEFYRQYAYNDNKVRSNKRYIINTMTIVRKLCKKCTVHFQKIKGHKDDLNPNTFVDRLAKLAIRR